MALGLTSTKTRHRFDAVNPVEFTVTDYDAFTTLLLRGQRQKAYEYFQFASFDFFSWAPPNQTDKVLAQARQTVIPTWILDPEIDLDTTQLEKVSGSDGFDGASADEYTNPTYLSIQAEVVNLTGIAGIALQSGTVNYDYAFVTDVEHAISISFNEIVIFEQGVQKLRVPVAVGDTVILELDNSNGVGTMGIVRYWLYKTGIGGGLQLLRSTRSKLIDEITPTASFYSVGSTLDRVLVWEGIEAHVEVEIVGVIGGSEESDFEDWENSMSVIDLGDKTVNMDKTETVTYFAPKNTYTEHDIDLAWREYTEYLEFLRFYRHHGQAEYFIFKSAARPDNADAEKFVRFSAPFTDSPMSTAIYGISTSLRECVENISWIFDEGE